MGLSRTVSEIDSDFSRKSQKKFTPLVFCAPLKGFPLELGTGAVDQKTTMMGLPGRQRISSAVWIQCTNVTGGRTDTGRQQRPRLRIASRGKNSNALCGDANPCRLERHSCSIWHHTFEGVLLATIGVDYYIIFRCQNYSIN